MAQRLTDEALREYNDAFQEYDMENNGYITTKDLKALVKSLGCNPTDSEIQQIVNEVDADENGKVSFDEFVCLMEKMRSPNDERDSILDAFRVFDPYNKGYINSEDLKDALQKYLVEITPDELHQLIELTGVQEKRKLNFKEFSKIVLPEPQPEEPEEEAVPMQMGPTYQLGIPMAYTKISSSSLVDHVYLR